MQRIEVVFVGSGIYLQTYLQMTIIVCTLVELNNQVMITKKETKFTIDDYKTLDREDEELVVNIEFEYDWEERNIPVITLTDTSTGKEVYLTTENFYDYQINHLYHDCFEHVANRSEPLNF